MNAALLRAMRMFVQSRQQTALHRKINKIEAMLFERMVELFLAPSKRSSMIRGPQSLLALYSFPECSITGVVKPLEVAKWKQFLPPDNQALKCELTLAFLSYPKVGLTNRP
jgi:hypothetical protein